MVYIPAELFKNPAYAKGLLEVIELVDKIGIIPNSSGIKKPDNKSFIKNKMLKTNKKMYEIDLTDLNAEALIKKYVKARTLYDDDLPEARRRYISFSMSGNALGNRFSNFTKTIVKGVGVDGGGEHPKNYKQEERDLQLIEEGARKYNKWNIDNETLLKQSIANTIFWQSANFSQFAIGTPTQMVSAIIELTNCDIPIGTGGYKYRSNITGAILVTKRPETDGLQYLLDGNKFDIDINSSNEEYFNGHKKFLDHTLSRFFYSSDSADRGYFIKVGAAETKESSTGFELSSKDYLIGEKFYKNLLSFLNDEPMDAKDAAKTKFGMIMLIYSMSFSYIAYINNLYEILINSTKSKDLKTKYKAAKFYATKNFLNLVNYAINKNFKINLSNPEDLIIAGVKEEADKKSETVKKGPGAKEIRYSIVDKNFEEALSKVRMDGIKGKIFVGFKDISLYEKIFVEEDKIDEEMFKKDKYPIVFTDRTSDTSNDNIVDYVETTKRLVKFFLMDDMDSIPSINNVPIAVGAPFQNDEILEETAEALDGWYTEVIDAKKFYLNSMDEKIKIFMAAIQAKDISEVKDMMFKQLSLIGTTIPSTAQKDIKCLELINQIINKYKDYRKLEFRLTDEKTILVNNRLRVLGESPEDYPRQAARAIKKLHNGVKAVILVESAKISYDLFRDKNPTMVLCSDFSAELDKRVADIDREMNIKLTKMLQRKVTNIEKKYGKNALSGSKFSSTLISLGTLPSVPPSYSKEIWALISTATTGLGAIGKSGTLGPSGSRLLTFEQRNRVETENFWRSLLSAFGNKLVFLPVIIPSTDGFSSDQFYLVDMFNSMISERLYRLAFSKTMIGKLYERDCYIMFSNTTADLNDRSKWKAVNHDILEKLLSKGGDGKFKNIKIARDAFFNLLANNAFLTDALSISLPTSSNVSELIKIFCTNAIAPNKNRTKMANCNILISREQFAKNIQPNLSKFEASVGIDFMSGMSFAQFVLLSKSNYIVR